MRKDKWKRLLMQNLCVLIDTEEREVFRQAYIKLFNELSKNETKERKNG